MQSKKMNKYAKIIKISIIFIAIVCTGLLYCCNFKTDTDNLQLQSLESDDWQTGAFSSEASVSNENSVKSTTEAPKVYVYVCGCVTTPGVYGLSQDMRVYQAIEFAGGMTAEADYNYLNMAEFVTDGQKIYVPAISENLPSPVNTESVSGLTSTLININSATKEQLMTLPGIGESKADDIIAYRSAHGLFQVTEDIKNIPGIKEAAFAKLKDLIVVK